MYAKRSVRAREPNRSRRRPPRHARAAASATNAANPNVAQKRLERPARQFGRRLPPQHAQLRHGGAEQRLGAPQLLLLRCVIRRQDGRVRRGGARFSPRLRVGRRRRCVCVCSRLRRRRQRAHARRKPGERVDGAAHLVDAPNVLVAEVVVAAERLEEVGVHAAVVAVSFAHALDLLRVEQADLCLAVHLRLALQAFLAPLCIPISCQRAVYHESEVFGGYACEG